jgi:retron-type reverse transcriptase
VTTCVLLEGRGSGPEEAANVVREEIASVRQMAIVEKYEVFLNYVYAIAQNIPSSGTSKTAVGFTMGKKYRNLMPLILADENLRLAYRQTSRGKRLTKGYLQFKEYAEANIGALKGEIATGEYRLGEYRHFTVLEPKPRLIMALPFRDRLAQHALVNVIEPIFEKTFLPMSFACRTGRGTHSGMIQAQALMRRLGKDGPVYCLKMDFKGFFHNIDRARLHTVIRRKIKRYSARGELAELGRFLASWRGHAQWADSHNLVKNLERGIAK